MEKLTRKQALFVAEYLVDLNATRAYGRAGYAGTGNGAEVNASKLLRSTKVAYHVSKAMEERGERTKITADQVLREIERLAMYDPAHLIKVKSPDDIAKLPEDVRRAITGWKWDKDGNFIITMAKQGALEMLGRHHKLFTDRLEIKDTTSRADRLSAARARKAVK